uniref:Centromere protein Q n=1 Tax=Sinocyclocheilus rhinocerous TaxID=307959 RepID=A0A673LZ92_9TELE
MKPARGSGRASTRGPRGATDRNTHKTHKTSKPRAEGPHPEPSNKHSVMAGKSKSKGNWKPLTKSSLLALENMLGLSIVMFLHAFDSGAELCFRRFLAKCAQLSVPPRKHGDIMHVSRQFKAERTKSEHGRKTLEALEENTSSIVSTLEVMEVRMDGLEEKCRIMRRKLDEEEDKAHEFLQQSEQTVLRLPALPSLQPTLQVHHNTQSNELQSRLLT